MGQLDFAAIGFPTFSMRLASDRGATAVDEDGLTVGLWIRNLLPCVSFYALSVELVSADSPFF